MKPVRRLMDRLQSAAPIPAAAGKGGGKSSRFVSLQQQQQANEVGSSIDSMLRADPVTTQDMVEALQTTRPSSDQTLQARYEEWQRDFGSV
jgi:SpoVK/Ycf46/Vps4 family AAA+-type ATPase